MKFKIFHAPDGSHSAASEARVGIAPPPVKHGAGVTAPTKIAAHEVSVFYGEKQALHEVSLDIPDSLTEPAGALPSLIYIWENASERAFHERSAAAIMVLLAFMIVMNAAAVLLRRHFERRW